MSDETASSPEIAPLTDDASAPRPRRVSTPRPKKAAKKAALAVIQKDSPNIALPEVAPPQQDADFEAPLQPGNDWAEPEGESAGGQQSQPDGPKRKRRRRKGKGQSNGPQNSGVQNQEDVYTLATEEPAKPADLPQDQRQRPAPQPHQPQRPKVDPELLTKMAWKIYLAEVSEEGVALIGDNDAKDLSRRCFRLAEIFIEEQARRR